MSEPAANLVSLTEIYKHRYPQPGDRIPQYVLDEDREYEWENATCPRLGVDPHERPGCELHSDPECGHCHTLSSPCSNDDETKLLTLRDSACDFCNDIYERALSLPSVIAWFAEKAKRPPVEKDRKKLSDQVVPDYPPPTAHPLVGRFKP